MPEPWEPYIAEETIPAITPNETESGALVVKYPSYPPSGFPLNPSSFRMKGTYLDRSRKNEYDIISSWDTSEE